MKDTTEEARPTGCCRQKKIFRHHHCHGGNDAIYGLGVVGALFYFLKGASTLTAVIIGIGKSFFWPAILLFKVLTNLHI